MNSQWRGDPVGKVLAVPVSVPEFISPDSSNAKNSGVDLYSKCSWDGRWKQILRSWWASKPGIPSSEQ